MNNFKFINIFKRSDKFKRGIIFAFTALFVFSILITSMVTKKFNLKEGDIAKSDIKAPREVKDEVATEARVKQAVDAVEQQYVKKPEMKAQVVKDMNSFFDDVTSLKDLAIDDKEKVKKLKDGAPIILADESYISVLKLSKDEVKGLQNFMKATMESMYDSMNIYDSSTKDNTEDIKKAQTYISLKVNSSNLSKSQCDLATTIGNLEIRPNFFYDKEQTEKLKADAAKKVPPVMVKKDQTIVKEGEPVNAQQIEILKSVGLLNDNSNYEWYLYISLMVLICLILGMEWAYLHRYYKDIYYNTKMLLLTSVLTCISVILARSLAIISPFVIPLACVPMLATLLLGYKVSLCLSVLNCVLISGAVSFNIEATLICIVSSVVGAIILSKMQQRNDILYSSIYIAIASLIMEFSAGFLLSNNIMDVVRKASLAFTGGILSGILTIGMLPFLESTFGIVTTIKLLELTNPNHPVLKKLLLEAPGTYHHSILVGNLAEVAAEAVGGNPVLARVAAQYHDIGKIKRPYFFKENQLGNDNPHNKITPNLSTLIITSHVKDGVEMAKEYKIPKVITDIIEQHHGDSLVKYFYITMKNSAENPDDVNEDDFRYPGPIPETKEAAIIMLADGVEAAVRSIQEPTRGKIEEMVNNIIKSRLNEGQLDNCDLTLKDLTNIQKVFLKVLDGIYHQRIEYPEDKWAKKQNEAKKLKD